MKLKLLLLTFILCSISTLSFSQSGCLVMRDSIVRLDTIQPTITHHYFHNASWPYNLEFAQNDSMVTDYDSIFYNAFNQVIKTCSQNDTFLFTYTGGLVSRVDGMGTNGNGPWTISHDIFYTSGQISSIRIDTNSVTGDSYGFPGDFINITWAGGNPVSAEGILYSGLVGGPFGFTPVDTAAFAITCDNKNNILKQLYPMDGTDDLIMLSATNNPTLIVFSNDVPVFGANTGDTIQYKVYTYNANNDVASVEDKPNAFDNTDHITYYFYDCSVSSIEESEDYSNILLYPNPTTEELNLLFNSEKNRTIQIFSSNGSLVAKHNIVTTDHTIDVSTLSRGIYFITISDDEYTINKKFIIE